MGVVDRARREVLVAEMQLIKSRVETLEASAAYATERGPDAQRDHALRLEDAYLALTATRGELREFDEKHPASSIDRALTDMREGRRVLVITPGRQAAVELWADACGALVDGGKSYRSVGDERIVRKAGGSIAFRTYDGVHPDSLRGLELDSVYIDNTAVFTALSPCLSAAAEPRIAQFPS